MFCVVIYVYIKVSVGCICWLPNLDDDMACVTHGAFLFREQVCFIKTSVGWVADWYNIAKITHCLRSPAVAMLLD